MSLKNSFWPDTYIKSEKGDFVLIKEKDLFIEKFFFSELFS